MSKYLIGVDVGGTSIKIGQFTLDGILIEKWDIPTNKSNQGDRIISDIASSLINKLDVNTIEGIGIGVPGPVTNGLVLNGVNIGWGTKNVSEEFYQHFPHRHVPIRVSNDANVACAGEVFQGSGKGYKNVVMFTLGTGVGGGILIDGKIVDGQNGYGGELGHMSIDSVHKIQCNCGKKGCLETVTSATGIVNLAKIRLAESNLSSQLRQLDSFSAKRVFDYAKQGDEIALEVIEEAADYLAHAISIVSYVLNPELFIIGGGVSNAGDFLIQKIKKHYQKYVASFLSDQKIVIASLGNDAGIYGAAYMVK